MKVGTKSDSAPAPAAKPSGSYFIIYILQTERALGDEIRLEATYYPNLLPDHQGPYFQHSNAKLIQLNIRDVNKSLIAQGKLTISFDLELLC